MAGSLGGLNVASLCPRRRRLSTAPLPLLLASVVLLLLLLSFSAQPAAAFSDTNEAPSTSAASFVLSASADGLGALDDRALDLGPYFFNPSVVPYGGQYFSAARTAYMRVAGGRWWWHNGAKGL